MNVHVQGVRTRHQQFHGKAARADWDQCAPELAKLRMTEALEYGVANDFFKHTTQGYSRSDFSVAAKQQQAALDVCRSPFFECCSLLLVARCRRARLQMLPIAKRSG